MGMYIIIGKRIFENKEELERFKSGNVYFDYNLEEISQEAMKEYMDDFELEMAYDDGVGSVNEESFDDYLRDYRGICTYKDLFEYAERLNEYEEIDLGDGRTMLFVARYL